MARIRTIKPEFWTDAKIIELQPITRLLFIGLWSFADDSGSLQNSPKQIKMRIFPADSIDVEPLVTELITHGLLSEYEVDGNKYLNIKNFRVHQKINRPSKPVCPPPPEPDLFTEHSPPEGNGREGKGVSSLRSDSTERRKTKRTDTVARIPLVDKTDFTVTRSDIAEWAIVWPGVDTLQCIREMVEWTKSRPTRRKTRSGCRRFITAWLAREQNSGRKPPVQISQAVPRI